MKVCEVLDCFKCLFQSLPAYSKLSVNDDHIVSQTGVNKKYCNIQNSIYYAVAAVSRAIFQNDTLIF